LWPRRCNCSCCTPPADLVEDLDAELDDVEGVQDLHGVGQAVAQRLGVAAERVECGLGDLRPELGLLGIEPAGVGRPRPPQNQI
jgi:hypothetical protein